MTRYQELHALMEPGRRYTISELVGLTGMSGWTVRDSLNTLYAKGLAERSDISRKHNSQARHWWLT